MFFYIVTFLLGLFLDSKYGIKYKKLRLAFIIWLYVFLCFGYMTGSDWRFYELEYDSISSEYSSYTYDKAFYLLMYFSNKIFSDFFVFLGILKCLFLTVQIKLLKSFTEKWLSAISLIMPGSLIFLLIDNPLRFMVALTFVYLSVLLFKERKFLIAIVFALLAPLFQATTFLCLLLIPLMFFDLFSRVNRILLFTIYMVVVVAFSDLTYIGQLTETIIERYTLIVAGKDYSVYTASSSTGFFTIGSFLQIGFFLIVLLTRDFVINTNPYGKIIYSAAIAYCILQRVVLLVPTGFRLIIPLSIMLALYMLFLFSSMQFFRIFLTCYFLIMLVHNLDRNYVYIPYSNSIYYIVKGHKTYSERSNYNLEKYQQRKGYKFDY